MAAHPRTCPLCEATCGLLVELDGDRVTSVRPDPDDVFSKGFICPKGAVLGDLHDDPDRIRVPMVREGDAWREVTWEAALERVAEGLQPILAKNRNAVAAYFGNPSVHSLDGMLFNRAFIKALGTRNLYTATSMDQLPKHLSAAWMFGHPLSIPVPDLDRCDWLLMLGANPLMSNGSLCTAPDFPGRMKRIVQRGKVIVVDPRRTRTADKASEHHFIRPGADGWLLAAMTQVIFDEGLVSEQMQPVTGLDELAAAMAPFTPERVESAVGIDATTIRRLARELAAAERAAVYGRMGTCTQRFGTLNSWLIDVLNTLTGHLDTPGGAMWPMPAHTPHRPSADGKGRRYTTGRWKSRVRGLPERLAEMPIATLADEIEVAGEGQVRALVTVAGNPVLSAPNGRRLDTALASLDFMVSVDPYLNETTRHADVILPPPSQLARGHYDMAFYGFAVRNVAKWSPPLVEADGLLEWEILAKLAAITAGAPAATPASVVDEQLIAELIRRETRAPGRFEGADDAAVLASLGDRRGPGRALDFLLRAGAYDDMSLDVLEASPHGVDLGALKPRLPALLRTPSGSVELAPVELLADVERLEAELEDAGGLVLVGRRHLRSNNSWMHNLPRLVKGKPRCTLHVHPDDALVQGLVDGADAEVSSRVGTVTATVEVTDSIRPGVVSLPHGWGHGQEGSRMRVAAQHAGVNSNVLTDDLDLDPVSGTVVLNGIPVTVAPL